MFRVKYKNPKEWVFVRKKCLLDVKKDNPTYIYGGDLEKIIVYDRIESLIN